MKNDCGSCRFYDSLKSNCHKSAPSVFPVVIQDPITNLATMQLVSAFPLVNKTDWCGEHEASVLTITPPPVSMAEWKDNNGNGAA